MRNLDLMRVGRRRLLQILLLAPLTVRAEQAATHPALSTQPSPAQASGEMKRWFADLGNANPDVRDDALAHLMSLKRADLTALRALVEQDLPLLPAQAAVLRQIVGQIYLAGEKYEESSTSGFLGIRTDLTTVAVAGGGDEQRPSYAIVVAKCMPGFCGARELREGDLILSIIERPTVEFTNPTEFAIAVRDMGPHQMVHLQVLRRGQVRQVAILLDSRPVELDDPTAVDAIMDRRQARFDQFWQDEFVPLLVRKVS